jgi:hypothetical protein
MRQLRFRRPLLFASIVLPLLAPPETCAEELDFQGDVTHVT